MNYLLKNRRREPGIRKSLLGTLAILVLAGFFYFVLPKFSNQVLYSVARPIWSVRDYIGGKFSGFWANFYDKETLIYENLTLKVKLDEAGVALLDLDVYKKENEDLKKLLGRNDVEPGILASILSKPNDSIYDTLVIDAGENQGVKAGDKVLFEDFVIGEAREVLGGYSKVVLSSAPGETFTVRIGDNNIDTQAEGRGAGNFIARLPKEIKIQIGDLVRVPGIKPRFFGAVEDVERTETGAFQFILFKMPVNVNTIAWVEVVKAK